MDDLRRLGDRIPVRFAPDEDGFIGRECPQESCGGYFKIEPGTGLEGEDLPCHCPYCGYAASHEHFVTMAQVEYAVSVAARTITDAIHKDLKALEFEHKPSSGFGIGFSLTVHAGPPIPIRYYRERRLETEVICTSCKLRYSVYGVFAYCPDCGQHNTLQILDKNLELVSKMLDLTESVEAALAKKLVQNALEDCVSAFDGFGRHLCRVYVDLATDAGRCERLSFQNLEGANRGISTLFGLDLSRYVSTREWNLAVRAFQKRHLLAHKMGVVDKEYVKRTGDPSSVAGRKVAVDVDEVRSLVATLASLARHLDQDLGQKRANK